MFWRSKWVMISSFLSLLSVGACANAWRDFADKSSDSYLMEQARNSLDALNFDKAIIEITPVIASNPQNMDAAYIGSSAYAGRAGLRILDLFISIGNDISSKTLLTILAQHFIGATDQSLSDMNTSVSLLEGAGPNAASRSTDMNFYALLLYYARIGVNLNRYAFDVSANTLLPNFNACYKTVDLVAINTGIPDAAIDNIMISVPRIIDAISGVTGSGDAFSAILNASILPASLPSAPIPCSLSSVNVQCLAIRTLITNTNVGAPGIGGLGGAACVGPVP